MRLRIGTVTLLAVFAAASTALAQAPAGPPKPGPEVKKLAYFEGKWVTEGQQKANPWGPAGTFKSNDVCEWVLDGFFMKCTSEGKDPVGSMKGIGLMGYDAENKVYIYLGADNRGMGGPGEGTLAGKVWTYTSSMKMGGKVIKSRYVATEGTPTEYTFKWDMADDKGNWMTMAEGKSTRAK
ncbi:MAG TPA: DUF1579 family protein [Thermoanaerobaculia bacterium]|nr:DUF1579 family protein [Thermoanaerobaculia bacterium]HQR65882.1 DUF1579 family protein [Thermoanaerobaculia bacterium]